MTIYNTEYISDAMSNDDTTKPIHHVFLNLKARNPEHTDNNFETNRIGLKCDTVGISTGRTIPSIPIPGMGVITGESQTIAMDLGMASKSINLSGIITNQVISKAFDDPEETDAEGNPIDSPTVEMTAFEIAQLIHSFVDSSGFQRHQTLNELIILIPSRVDHKYEYYSDLPEYSDPTNLSPIEYLPLIPFSYKVRDQDNKGTVFNAIPGFSNFPKPIQNSTEVTGLKGFIRSFSTTLTAGQPFVQFNLDFEVAFII